MRFYESLNEDWKFAKTDQVPEKMPCHGQDKDWEWVDLPHTWNNWDGQDGGGDYYKGKGVYLKTIERPDVPADYKIYLEFEGVNSVAEVYLNNEKVCEHKGGYSAFRVDATEALKEGKAYLAVVADNKNRTDVYPQMADFTFYGGIYRNVTMICVSPTHFCLDYFGSAGVAFDTKLQGEDALVNLSAWVTDAKESDMVQFEIMDEDESVVAEAFAPAAWETKATACIPGTMLQPTCCSAIKDLHANILNKSCKTLKNTSPRALKWSTFPTRTPLSCAKGFSPCMQTP